MSDPAFDTATVISFKDIHTGNLGKMIILLTLNITMKEVGGASVIAIFTTRRSHGYVNTTTWLGISQIFLFLASNFNIFTTENRSRCNQDLNYPLLQFLGKELSSHWTNWYFIAESVTPSFRHNNGKYKS